MNLDNENTVSLETAEKWTQAWRDKHPGACKAFLMPAVDLIEVLNEMGLLSDKVAEKAQGKACVKGLKVRAYTAIGSDEPDEDLEEKLLLLATKKDKKGIYRDIINGKIDNKNDRRIILKEGVEPIEPISSGIYDFTDPCPPSCDPNSPLN